MKRALIVTGWIVWFVVGVLLRFDHLGERPFHADEATGARIAAARVTGGGRFDPKHYHGPLLHDLAERWCALRGERGWREMTKPTLRAIPAIAGSLLVLVPLLWRRRFGDGPMLLAAAFLATSPLLVYYSRMFIHESLLALFGMLAVAAFVHCPRWGIPGVLLGLMFAAKETVAISLIAWTGAGLWVAWENRRALDRAKLTAAWRDYRMPALASALAAVLVAAWFYTDAFRHPRGAIDAVRTFFVYETVAGHAKPAGYYLDLLAIPRKAGRVWWFGTPVVLLALAAYAATIPRGGESVRGRRVIRFLAYAALGHFAIYSCIAYKTPWLACLPWAHVCLLAGFGFAGFPRQGRVVKPALVALAAAAVVTQAVQSRRAIGRFASDERNPFAYVPTRGEMEDLETWLKKLREAAPSGSLEPVAVVGSGYWPLPWYLRAFEQTGYWKQAPENLTNYPLVFALPDAAETVSGQLGSSHVPLPRGLRAGAPMTMFVRNEVWENWMKHDGR